MHHIRTFTFFILVLFGSITALTAQKFSIEGSVADSMDGPLAGASVILLQAADSIMTDFVMADREGLFAFRQVATGNYVLQVSFVGYNTYYRPVTITSATVQLGMLKLEPASTILGAAEVTADRIPIAFKKDTIEYDADAFKTQPHAVAEDLLRQLPGVQVDRNGNIKAQGKDVQQIMVDGKEFFGNDPKIASKNLPADAIDKVQIFDKKSEMAEFTGIDDGERSKTINLELKEDKKQGYFGNVSGGYGTDDRFEGKANINRFNSKTQLSFIGSANNINRPTFSMNDYINLAGGFQNMAEGEGGRLTFNVGDGEMNPGMQQQPGLKTAYSGGFNLNHDFGTKTKLNASYFGNFMRDLQYTTTHRQNLFEGNNFTTEDISDNATDNFSNRFNWSLKTQLDSTQKLTWRGNFNLTSAKSLFLTDQENYDGQQFLKNKSESESDADGSNSLVGSKLLYRKLLNKTGRTIVGEVSGNLRNNNRTTLFNSINTFYEADTTSVTAFDQRQLGENTSFDYKGKISFIEPIGKHHRFELSYAHQNFRTDTRKDFYDLLPGNPVQEVRNKLLSNLYRRDYYYDRVGTKWSYGKNKLKIYTGIDFQQSTLKGTIGENANLIKKDFSNFLPNWRLEYDFSGMKNLSFDYNTSVREPSLEQLQPIVDNTNPLNIYTGNPDLLQEYNHNAGANFMLFDQFNFINFFAGLNATYTRNPIVQSRRVDSLLRQITQPVNAPWEWNINGYLSFGAPLKFIKSQFRIEPNINYNKGLVYVNDDTHIANRLNTGGNIVLENRKKDKVDIVFGTDLSYSQTSFEDGYSPAVNYLTTTYYTDWTVNFLKTWSVGSGFDYTVYSKEAFGSPLAIPIWKASLSKYLFDRRGKLQLSAFDLLNQNLGIRRNSDLNYLEEVQTRTIGRYVMLSFSYNLSKLGGPDTGVNIEIRGGRD